MSQSYRQIFANFQKSNIGKDAKSFLYRDQLGMCPSCMRPFSIQELEVHHMKPIKVLEEEGDLKGLTHPDNLILLCRSCNASQGCRIDTRFL